MALHAPALPYVDGRPAPLGLREGLVVLLACATAFAALIWLPRLVPGPAGGWMGAVAFVGMQVAGLCLAVGPAWTALFRRPRTRDVLVALACVPLVVGVPALVALGLAGGDGLIGNPVLVQAADLSAGQQANLFAMSAVQLLGEELVTLLPLLVLVAALQRSGLRPWLAIAIAWVGTALAFGALHLPTYQWHLGQALLVIGSARLVLTGIFLLTRNLWASTLAHVANDWSLIAFTIMVAHVPPPAG